MTNAMTELFKDLLFGARSIAREVFGDDSRQSVRKIYHLAATGQITTRKKGAELIASRRQLRRDFGLAAEDQVG
jgi:hypothetical protein